MLVMPIVYVRDLERSLPFYEASGFELVRRQRNGRWAELRLGEAKLGLHVLPSLPQDRAEKRVELALESQEPLDALHERLIAASCV